MVPEVSLGEAYASHSWDEDSRQTRDLVMVHRIGTLSHLVPLRGL